MMDFLTCFAWTVPLLNQQAPTIACAIVNIFLQIGFPAELLSNAGTNFISHIMTEMCKLLDITKMTVQPLDQKANGLAERFMATLANGLTHYVASNQHDWCKYLPFIMFAYNAAEQKSVGESPFFLMYHRDPKIPMDNLLAQTASPYQEQLQPHETIALNFQLAWQNAWDNLQQHQRHQKQHYDKAAIPSKITPGSKVLIWCNTIKPGPIQ